MSARRRLGLFGGTFDPIHVGHLDLALACRRQLDLDEVRFLTAREPPHKPAAEATSHDRHAMVAVATAGEEAFVADARELSREGPTYTVETLEGQHREMQAAGGGAEVDLFFLVGADSLRDFPTWHRWQDILGLATMVAVGRDGIDLDDAARAAAAASTPGAGGPGATPALDGRVVLVRHVPPPWSSTEIRAATRRGEQPEGLPPAVAEYIRKNRLYGWSHPLTGETQGRTGRGRIE